MKKILMFDDFLVSRTDNTRRRFHQPEWSYEEPFLDPASPQGTQGLSVIPAPGGGWYLTYLILPGVDSPYLDEDLRIGMAWSRDGVSWTPFTGANPGNPEGSHVLGHGAERLPMFPYHDSGETDPSMRYKAVAVPYGRAPTGPVAEAPFLLASADALRWRVLDGDRLLPGYVDCHVSLVRNPFTGRFQAATRRRWGERRICLVESADLRTWTPPRAMLHPLPTDPPSTHFYAMQQFYDPSAEMFLGMLWTQLMPYDRVMEGPMGTEYVYSYDGLCWNRTFAPAVAQRPYGTLGGGGAFVFSVNGSGEDLLFHATAFLYEHGGLPAGGTRPAGAPGRAVIRGRIGRDRVVGIESGKGTAEMATLSLKLRKPELRLNAHAPFGSLRAEIRRDGKPVEGYSFDDCGPLSGDLKAAPLRWKGGTLERFCGGDQWVRLHLRMAQAEIFALEGDFLFTINPRAAEYERL